MNNSQRQSAIDATMDPWCAVPLISGDEVLFGFAVVHVVTGGLSWLRSTPIRQLDEAACWAITASGRQYRLGRHIRLHDIPNLGDEAHLAYDLLIGSEAASADAVPPISSDRPFDAVWLTTCKLARHLDVEAPDRTRESTRLFLDQHSHAYLALRTREKQA